MKPARQLAIPGFILVVLLVPLAAHGDVTPHALISDGMVLQQQRSVNLWGTAARGEKVTVEFRDQTISTFADDHGQWLVRVESKQAGGPFPLRIAGRNTITLKNVMVGEVWVASGQSNMGWPVATRPGAKDLVGTQNPSIRLFNVAQKFSASPSREAAGRWEECGPESLINFSAVAYYFGRQIQGSQQVPVGLIHASYGGSGILNWIGADTLAEDPTLQTVRKSMTEADELSARNQERLKPEIERYQTALAQARQNGTPLPLPPRGINVKHSESSRLFNGMVAPLLLFQIRGVIWYQGEADVSRAGDYEQLFSALILGWRKAWGQGDFPFLFVQLAPFGKIVDQPQESDWARLREAQLRVNLRIPRTGMAVITDWGHETDIHVKQKRPVGERLSRLARVMAYGEKLIDSAPRWSSVKFQGHQAQLTLTDVGTGLSARRLILEDLLTDPRDGKTGRALHVVAAEEAQGTKTPLQGFAVAGSNRRFFPAVAEIQGDKVLVSSPEVPVPVAVRYGWGDYPIGNLFNSAGLPASPFRTDDWPPLAAPRPANH